MKKTLSFQVACMALVFAVSAMPRVSEAQIVSAAGCNNPNYAIPSLGETATIRLCNDPIADGIFTEDGVTGYQYVYDVYQDPGRGRTFWLGGTKGDLGVAGAFDGSASAWYRVSQRNPDRHGVWQSWFTQNIDYHYNTDLAHMYNTPGAVWTEATGWDPNVTDISVPGHHGPTGDPVPWGMINTYHDGPEYDYTSLYWYTGHQDYYIDGLNEQDTTGLQWSETGGIIFSGSGTRLQGTIRIVSPYSPGSINYGMHARTGQYGVITGPGGDLYQPPITCDGIVGDANCDGYVDVGNDIFPAFSNFTGPGSFGMERAQGDVQGNATGATANLDPHDGDVDVSDIITMFSNFTGPAPPSDEAGGLVAAEALDSTIPDLIYDASTGEVLLDLDSAVGFTGYVLNSANGFITGNHTPFMAGVTTTLPYELAEATFGTPAGPYPKSIGNVFPSGMDMAALSAFLTGNQVSRGNNQPIVPFDLVIVNPVSSGVPEPAAVVMGLMALAGLGMVAYRRRRNA